MKLSTGHKSVLLIAAILLIDQLSKLYVKLHFTLGESVEVFPWFQILFVENNGMAFGIEWFNKLFLTLFRIVAVGFITYYLYKLIKAKVRLAYVLTISLVWAGAMGNIIDCVLYGVLFDASTPWNIASFLPQTGGYAPLFYGKVVDMFYFPLIHNSAGEVIFFNPVFNVADSAISIAMVLIIIFFRKDLNDSFEDKKAKLANDTKE